MKPIRLAIAAAVASLGALGTVVALHAQTPAPAAAPNMAQIDATLRKNLVERVPSLGKIDEVNRTPMAGVYEVRVGNELFYSDADGSYLINGQIIDTKAKRNLTEERLDKLLAIDFDTLPIKDAFTIVRGNGKRKIAVFEDPNCGYCKRFERDLQKIDNVTVYMFLYPILGPDSVEKSRTIWCSRDKGKTWQDWMVRDMALGRGEPGCDDKAIARNVEFGRKNKITGTPTLLFADGTRVPGAIPAADVEKMLSGNK